MNLKLALLALVLSPFLAGTVAAAEVDAAKGRHHHGPSGNRIVGLWLTHGEVRPCGSSLPFNVIRNTLLFNFGGTWLETPVTPPNGIATIPNVPGVNQRTDAMGTWSFNRSTRQYTGHLRFDWYVDGAYHGYQTVDRQLLLSNDGNTVSGPVRSTRYAADGSIVSEVCGSAVSTRE